MKIGEIKVCLNAVYYLTLNGKHEAIKKMGIHYGSQKL
jgi:hypothetical protein